MDLTRPGPQKFLTLQETAQKLGVSVDVLLRWNEYHILKPTITPSGQAVYTEQQINEFLAIQQTRQNTPPITPDLPQQAMPAFPATHALQKTTSLRYIFLGATVLVFITLLFVSQGSIATRLVSLEQGQQTTTHKEIQTSTLRVDKPITSSLPNQGTTENNDLGVAGKDVFANAIYTAFHPPVTPLPAKTVKNQKALAGAVKKLTDTSPSSNSAATNQAMNDVSTFASTIQRYQSNTDLANNLSGNTTAAASKTNPLTTTVVAGIIMLLFFLMYRRQLSYALHDRSQIQSSTAKANAVVEKIIEIGQKMDGAVVVYCQGKEFKISKPELNSDSDQFIERLMELSQHGIKEMEYDSLTDEELTLNVPLSRLVTRLGFVGMKRDLFFPRTSKHSVLFRKYITASDLANMQLSPEQVFSALTQNS